MCHMLVRQAPPPPFLISARPLGERPEPIREHALWEFSRGEQRRAEESRGAFFTCSSALCGFFWAEDAWTDRSQNLDSNLEFF